MSTIPPRIPRPPSPEEIEEVSRDQAMISDEWAPEPAPKPPSGDTPSPRRPSPSQ